MPLLHLSLSCLALASALCHAEIELKLLSHGFEGRTRSGAWTPVVVEVTNRGEIFSGILEIRPVSGDETDPDLLEPVCEYPVSLPPNSTQNHCLCFLCSAESRVAMIRLLGPNQEEVRRVLTSRFTTLTGKQPLVLGVGNIPFLKRFLGPDEDLSREVVDDVVFAEEALLPDHWAGYQAVTKAIVYQADWAGWRPSQLHALEGWVASGGNLVLAGDSLPAEDDTVLGSLCLSKASPREKDVPGEAFRCLGENLPPGPIRIRRFEADRGRPLVEFEGDPILVGRWFGAGHILFLPLDLRQENVLAWPDRTFLKDTLLLDTSAHALLNFKQKIGTEMLQLEELNAPPFWRLGLYLLPVIMILGPANYLVLKFFRRKEWAVITIPALALLFTWAGYQWTLARKGDKAIFTRKSLIFLSSDNPVAHRWEWVGLFSPGLRPFRFVPSHDSAVWGQVDLPDVFNRNSNEIQPQSRLERFQNDLSPGHPHPVLAPAPFQMSMWSFDIFHVRDFLEIGGLEGSLKFRNGRIVGRLNNKSDIEFDINHVEYGWTQLNVRVLLGPGQSTPVVWNMESNREDMSWIGGEGEIVPKGARTRALFSRMGHRVLLQGVLNGSRRPTFTLLDTASEERSCSEEFYLSLPVVLEAGEDYYPPGAIPWEVTRYSSKSITFHDSFHDSFNSGHDPVVTDSRAIREARWAYASIEANAKIELAAVIPKQAMEWDDFSIRAIPIPNQNEYFALEAWNVVENKWRRVKNERLIHGQGFVDRLAGQIRFRVTKGRYQENFTDLLVGLRRRMPGDAQKALDLDTDVEEEEEEQEQQQEGLDVSFE
ncbi:MAG: hypothetical protein HYU36_16275 [Planctomycetes bacterium]|nr:hypothetical protein [Planctomycetota bacterium]